MTEDEMVGWLDGMTNAIDQWTWILANSRIQWRTEEHGLLQPMGSKRDRHELVIE